MKFQYKIKTGAGETRSGTIEAESDTEAIERLSRQGYYILSLDKEEVSSVKRYSSLFFGQKIKTSDLVIFTTQLSDLLMAGVPLLRCLTILQRQFEGKKMGEIVKNIANDVKGGSSLNEAVNKYRNYFPSILPSLVATGEMSGNLDQTLKEAARIFERDEELRTKIKTASIYPLMIVSMGIVTIFILLSFVIPKISQVFADLGGILPLPTRILLFVSGIFYKFWPFILLGGILAIYLFNRIRKSPEKKVYLDRIYLKIPVLKNVIRDSETLKFSRTLGILLRSGVPILKAMENVATVLGIEDFRKVIIEIKDVLKDGESLSSALSKRGIFSTLVEDIIAIGEEGGKLDESLIKIGDIYEKRLDYTLKIATQLIEPILILIVGFAIGLIVIGMLLPLFRLNMLIK